MASTPTLDGNSGVYIGAWTNWSYGSVRGATITLTTRNGALLIAFLAFYVGLAGSSFWRIACFAIHQTLSSDRSEDGLYHQRQATLRNSATDVVGLWNFLQTNWFWRRNAGSSFRRMLPLVAFSILHIAVFGIAGIFSSQVSTAAGNEVLVSSSYCGYVGAATDFDTGDPLKSLFPYFVQTVILSASYVQQCYRQDAVGQSCKTFIQPNISTTSSTAACPFNGMCVGNGDIALVLDTGHLNSHFNLGLNAPPEDQFTVRKVTTCAPITTVGYSTPYHHTNSSVNDYVEYYYGPYLPQRSQPYSYKYPSHLETHSKNDFQNTLDYTIMALDGYPPYPTFDPIPRLKRSDADISLFLLSANNMVYAEPVDDPWYSAHLHFPGGVLSSHSLKGNASIWFRDKPVSVLGCAEQYQFCNPHLPANTSCTSLVGLREALNMTEDLWRSPAQNASFYSVSDAFAGYGIYLFDIVSSLGVSSLTARNSLHDGVQFGSLPNNQWQVEVQYWHSISMALLQRVVVEQATGPTSETVYPWLVKPQTKEEQARCYNQKIINTAYTNFSILGLSIVLVVGALLLLISVSIDRIVGYIQKRRNLKSYKRLEWSMNQTLQLQRLAHEELGYGTWTHAADSIPITQYGEKLSLIDTSDPDHPILVARTPADHTSMQQSEAEPDQDEEKTQSGGHPTPFEPAPVTEIISTGQSASANDETAHVWQPNAGSTQQTNEVTTVLQTVSVSGGSEEVGGSSSPGMKAVP